MKDTQHELDFLSAYIDGELSSKDAASVRDRLQTDADFYSLFNRLTASEDSIKTAIRRFDNTPVPDSIQALLLQPDVKMSKWSKNQAFFSDVYAAIARFPGYITAPVAAVMLLVTGAIFLAGPTPDRLSSAPASAYAEQSDLSNLSRLIAGETIRVEDKRLTEILAFKRRDGTLCKHYSLRGVTSVEAVACYETGAWSNVAGTENVVAPENMNGPEQAQYRMAGEEDTSSIDLYIEANITGSALTLDEERSLMNEYKAVGK